MSMVEKICEEIDKGNFPGTIYTIKNGAEMNVNNAHFNRHNQMQAGGLLQLLQNGSNTLLGQVTLDQLREFDKFLIDYSTSPTTYRNIKQNVKWQKLYQYEYRNLTYVDKDGTLSVKSKLSTPCRECGLLLHYKLVSVDHTYAQKGDTLGAIYKLFRAVGYTDEQPSGVKGRWISKQFAISAGGTRTAPTTPKAQLNAVGVIVYTLFRSGSYHTNLQNLSMHHFVNLRPVCSHCNPSLGNKI